MARKALGIFCAVALIGCGEASTPESAPPTPTQSTSPAPGATAQANAPAKPVEIAGLSFSLDRSGETCVLTTESQKNFDLNMPSSCKFHRLESGEIQVEKGHHGPVFLIVSSVKKQEGSDCDTRVAAVTISDRKTYVEPALSSSAACAGKRNFDDIYFLAPRFDGLPYPGDE